VRESNRDLADRWGDKSDSHILTPGFLSVQAWEWRFDRVLTAGASRGVDLFDTWIRGFSSGVDL
jgi:hypothetical protein